MRVYLQWVVFKCLNVGYHRGKCWSLEVTVTIPGSEGMSEKSQLPKLEEKDLQSRDIGSPRQSFMERAKYIYTPPSYFSLLWSPNGSPHWPSSEARSHRNSGDMRNNLFHFQ